MMANAGSTVTGKVDTDGWRMTTNGTTITTGGTTIAIATTTATGTRDNCLLTGAAPIGEHPSRRRDR